MRERALVDAAQACQNLLVLRPLPFHGRERRFFFGLEHARSRGLLDHRENLHRVHVEHLLDMRFIYSFCFDSFFFSFFDCGDKSVGTMGDGWTNQQFFCCGTTTCDMPLRLQSFETLTMG
jgi:hypothetical protein